MVNGITPASSFIVKNAIIERTVNFSSTNTLAASGTLVLVNDLFGSANADAVQIDEIHIKVNTVLNGSNGSNIDIVRRYGDPSTASDVTIFTAAGAIACDAAADTRQIFSKTTGTKLIDGAHPEDGSLSVATLDDAFVNRFSNERFQLRLSNPGAAAITSGKVTIQIKVSIGQIVQ
jgi:hypothetical protein